MRFRSAPKTVGRMSSWPAASVKNEPMLYRADLNYAMRHGGPITQEFLKFFSERGEAQDIKAHSLVIDSRVHMLMRGWYPCIPGWHHDDVPRGARGQPDYDAYNQKKPSQLMMAVIDASDAPTGSLTEFATGVVELPWPLDERVSVYGAWDAYLCCLPRLSTKQVTSGDVVRFDSNSLHRGKPALQTGFRYFIRALWNTNERPANETRKNANTYMQWSTAGW